MVILGETFDVLRSKIRSQELSSSSSWAATLLSLECEIQFRKLDTIQQQVVIEEAQFLIDTLQFIEPPPPPAFFDLPFPSCMTNDDLKQLIPKDDALEAIPGKTYGKAVVEMFDDGSIPTYYGIASPFRCWELQMEQDFASFSTASKSVSGDRLEVPRKLAMAWHKMSREQKIYYEYCHYEASYWHSGQAHAWYHGDETAVHWKRSKIEDYIKKHHLPYVERIDQLSTALDNLDVTEFEPFKHLSENEMYSNMHRMYITVPELICTRILDDKIEIVERKRSSMTIGRLEKTNRKATEAIVEMPNEQIPRLQQGRRQAVKVIARPTKKDQKTTIETEADELVAFVRRSHNIASDTNFRVQVLRGGRTIYAADKHS